MRRLCVELLNDDYIYGDKKVQLKTKTANGMTYTTTGLLKEKDESLAGDLSCKYSVSGATMTTKLFTSGKMTHEMVLEKIGVKGLKVTVLGGLGSEKSASSLVGTVEYVRPALSCVASGSALGSPTLDTAISVGGHGLTVGVEGSAYVESKELKAVNGVLNYTDGKEHEATFSLLEKASKAKFAYSHIVSSDFSVAGEFVYDKSKDTKELCMGTKYEVDRDTTLKTKINSAGAFSLAYIQEIRKNTTLTLCSKFDVRNLDQGSHKFGLALVIE